MELPDRQEHDDEAAAILALVLSRLRGELLARWDDGHRPLDDAFWAAFQQELADRMAVVMFGMFLASVRFHANGNTLDQRAMDAGLPWATERARYYAGLVTQTSRRWVDELMAGISTGLMLANEIQAKLDRIFGTTRADTIGSDIITDSQTAGGEWAMSFLGLTSPEDRWKTHPELTATGPCPICAPLDGTPRSHWELLFPDGPPTHVRCVCTITYDASSTPATT